MPATATRERSVVLLVGLCLGCGCATPHMGDRNDAGAGGTDGGEDSGGDSGGGPTESCGNGVDDDGDGVIDDGCPCAIGETHACFPGPLVARGAGTCRDGVMDCEAGPSTEFGLWGPCVGAVLPSGEICDALDNDCDRAVDEGCSCSAGETRPCANSALPERCASGTQTCDEGGTWSDCEGLVPPVPEVCGDGIDNDCDWDVDEGCGCVPEVEACDDGIDNDCDGLTDEGCGCVAEVCDDGIDNDCDGLTDEGCGGECGPLQQYQWTHEYFSEAYPAVEVDSPEACRAHCNSYPDTVCCVWTDMVCIPRVPRLLRRRLRRQVE